MKTRAAIVFSILGILGFFLALWRFIDLDRENIESTGGKNVQAEENANESNSSQRFQLNEINRSNEGEHHAQIAEEISQGPSDSDAAMIRFEALEDTHIKASLEGHDHIVRQWKGNFSPRIDKTLWRTGSRRDFSLMMPEGDPISVTIRDFKEFGESRGVYVCDLGDN